MRAVRYVLMLPVVLYRTLISPLKPPTCRFVPTCSAYALAALRERGALAGSWLTVRRLLRCHPFCEGGWDPVPGARSTEEHGADEHEDRSGRATDVERAGP